MGKKIKVLFFIQNLTGGGAERSITEIFKYYNRENFEYKLLLGKNYGEYYENFEKLHLIKENKINYFRYPGLFLIDTIKNLASSLKSEYFNKILTKFLFRLFYLRKIKTPDFNNEQVYTIASLSVNNKNVRRIRNAIINFQPDIVVGSLTETSNALIFCALIELGKQPLNFKWIAIEQNNTYQRFKGYYSAPNAFTFWNSFAKEIFKKADCIIAVSHGIKEGLIKYYKINSNKIKVIHNQVDTKGIQNAIPVVKKPFILAAGRLHEQKGFDRLLLAYSLIKNAIQEDLIILGNGKLENALKELASKLKISDRVTFKGFNPKIWSYMKAAQCFVLSSNYEGLPLVILEAMACGCPVISFDCDYGPSEIINDRINGILVPNDNVDQLSRKMLNLCQNKDLRMRLKENGMRRAKEFSSDKIAQKYEEVFSNLILR